MDLRNITELADRRPFRPFTIELDNGRRVTIRHPENLIFLPDRMKLWHIIGYDEENDLRVFFEPVAVSALTEASGDGGKPGDSASGSPSARSG